MKHVIELFATLNKEKVQTVTKLKDGITNDNYKIKTEEGHDYVLRIPKEKQIGIDRNQEKKIIDFLSRFHIDAPILSFNEKTGVKLSSYLPNKKTKTHFSLNQNIQFIYELKKLHSVGKNLSGTLLPFDPFKRIELYKQYSAVKSFEKEEEVIKQAKQLYDFYPQVLCHNDLLYSNILFQKKKAFIIDYEYAGLNIELFDVVSFLSENNIDNIVHQLEFLKLYYEKIDATLLKHVNIMYLLEDLLWSYWGYMMYELYNDCLYLTIAKQKSERYFARIRNF